MRSVAILSVVGLALGIGNVRAQPVEDVLLEADDVTYDTDAGVVAARGNVEIVAGGRILKADTVRYDQSADVVTASGNVSVLRGACLCVSV